MRDQFIAHFQFQSMCRTFTPGVAGCRNDGLIIREDHMSDDVEAFTFWTIVLLGGILGLGVGYW